MSAARPVFAAVLGLLLSVSAWSKPQLNSMCYLEDKTKAQVQGNNSQRRYEIASLSKIVTSFWALSALGPQYRFKTHLYVTAVSANLYDVHVSGGRDPYFGREMTYFLLSELYRLNIRNIRELSFDENFTFYWGVREHPATSVTPIPERVEATLREKLKFNAKDYTNARKAASTLGISLEAAPRVNITKIKYITKSEFYPAKDAKYLELSSIPLFRYLKEMNRVSNNHVADRLFDFLGGTSTFQAFIKKQLNYDLADIRFVNGSGDSFKTTNDDGKQTKIYNEASCDVLVHILDTTRDLLKKSGMDLENIMAVSGVDPRTTLSGRYSATGVSGAMVAKTGTVDTAVALAGMISTEQGDVYFGILYRTDGPADWAKGRDAIRGQVVSLMGKFGGKDTISNYHTATFLPFDSSSKLAAIQPITLPASDLSLKLD